jgi:glycosyltransferase involved in cell wall biosynthesis
MNPLKTVEIPCWPMISIFIPVKNEEKNLEECLRSVAWSDDIHVLDSGSTDATAEIARRFGANLTQRNAEGMFGGDESAHKNWAIRALTFKYPWVLHIDADERVTPELANSIPRAIANPGRNVAFRIQRRDFWGSRWLRHIQVTSTYPRLFRPEYLHYERLINPVSVINGPSGNLSGYLDHFPFSKGIDHWISRHNEYSTLEAKQIIAGERPFTLRGLLSRDRGERRRNQKAFFYRLPVRPLLKFMFLYIAKRGFLDGSEGFQYALLQSFYEFLVVEKSRAH